MQMVMAVIQDGWQHDSWSKMATKGYLYQNWNFWVFWCSFQSDLSGVMTLCGFSLTSRKIILFTAHGKNSIIFCKKPYLNQSELSTRHQIRNTRHKCILGEWLEQFPVLLTGFSRNRDSDVLEFFYVDHFNNLVKSLDCPSLNLFLRM